ncbi:hypothetical protein L286_06780 [Sphingobium sp. HDIP04]|nr:hypothetical protein L286_06780 [Sphingobium sp. HDIP04]
MAGLDPKSLILTADSQGLIAGPQKETGVI